MRKKSLKIKYLLITILSVFLTIFIIFILLPSSKKKPEIPPSYIETKKETSPTIGEIKKDTASILEAKKEPSSVVDTKKELSSSTLETKKENILKTENFRHVLEVIATDTTWLYINIDNTDVKEILMKPGESIKLQAKDNFSVKIGNAGGVMLVFDGEKIEKLGERNQVVKLNLPI